MKNKIKIMMIGTSFEGKGGIATVVRGYKESKIFDDYNIDYFTTHCEGIKIKKIFYYFFNLIGILIKIHYYSIIHLHTASYWSFRRLFIVMLISKICSKKLIVHVHGAIFDQYYSKSFSLEKHLIKYGLSITDKVVCLSPEWSQKLNNLCSTKKIVVIPNCVKLNTHKTLNKDKKISSNVKSILFLGEIGKRKGSYDLIEAVKIINYDSCRVKLILCGDGNLQEINNIIKNNNLQNCINLPGWVTGQQKENYLLNAYIYVMPSYFEGLPMSILEAMSFGLPIISTNIGGIPYAIEDGKEGYLISPGDPRELANKIEKLLNDEKKWLSMSIAAKEKIENNFSINSLRIHLKTLYENFSHY